MFLRQGEDIYPSYTHSHYTNAHSYARFHGDPSSQTCCHASEASAAAGWLREMKREMGSELASVCVCVCNLGMFGLFYLHPCRDSVDLFSKFVCSGVCHSLFVCRAVTSGFLCACLWFSFGCVIVSVTVCVALCVFVKG